MNEAVVPVTSELAERRVERIQRAPNFVDGRFVNPTGIEPKMEPGKSLGLLKELIVSAGKRRPPAPLPMVSPLDAWRSPARTGLRTTWLGHSTTLLEIDGVRVLTDPVWADRASPSQALGPRRFHRPPVDLTRLPPIDVVLVSHDHYDHLDADAIAALARSTKARFVTALGVGAHLERFGVEPARIHELSWWEQLEVPGTSLVMTATPAQHFSGRGLLDRNRTLWASWVLAGPRHRVFFSGDTGLEPTLGRVGREHGPFDLILLEVGAFHPAWGTIHLGPWQAMEAHAALGGGALLPVHWSTFDLALHAWDEPIVVLEEAAREARLPLLAPLLGEARDVGDLDDVRKAALVPWWRVRTE